MKLSKSEVIIINENNFPIPSNIEKIVDSTLTLTDQDKNISVTISFVTLDEMVNLNKLYRGYAHPTDVLSFEADEFDPETGRKILGDIIICYPFVKEQSYSFGNKIEDEIYLMVIHGILHLSGFVHDDETQKSIMWDMQSRILKENNIHLTQLPE